MQILKIKLLLPILLTLLAAGCATPHTLAYNDCNAQGTAAIPPEYKKEMRQVREVVGKKVVGQKKECTKSIEDPCLDYRGRRDKKCESRPKEVNTCITKNMEEDVYGYVEREVNVDLNAPERAAYIQECMKDHPSAQK